MAAAAAAITPVRAAGIILCRKGSNNYEYLLLKASYGDFHWSPPKGLV